MYFGTETFNKVNSPIVLEIEVDHDFYEYTKKNNIDILEEASSVRCIYSNNVKIQLLDAFSSTRGQIQSDKNKFQAVHDNRVKIEAPADFKGMCIVIPSDKDKPVYLAKGNDRYTGNIPKNIKDAVDQVQRDRKYLDIIFDNPGNMKMQNRAFLQMIKKNDNIKDVTYEDKKIEDKAKTIISKRKE